MTLLVPTRVGMILERNEFKERILACPHTRGDDPILVFLVLGTALLSPHAWG